MRAEVEANALADERPAGDDRGRRRGLRGRTLVEWPASLPGWPCSVRRVGRRAVGRAASSSCSTSSPSARSRRSAVVAVRGGSAAAHADRPPAPRLVLAFGAGHGLGAEPRHEPAGDGPIVAFAAMLPVALICIRYRPTWVGVRDRCRSWRCRSRRSSTSARRGESSGSWSARPACRRSGSRARARPSDRWPSHRS